MSRILCLIDGMTGPGFSPEDYPHLRTMTMTGPERHTPPGMAPETLNCTLYLLGIRPVPGDLRAYVEALGGGVEAAEEDLLLRLSWYGVDSAGHCTVPIPAPALPGQPGLRHHILRDYQSLLLFPGQAYRLEYLTTRPPLGCHGVPAVFFRPLGFRALEDFFDGQLALGRCPIPWAQARKTAVPPFPVPAAAVCAAPILKGIARLLGMELRNVPGATGDTDTDLSAKTRAALEAAEKYDFVLLHLNGADEASHRLSPEEKRDFLMRADATVLPPLLASRHGVRVTADHATDPRTGRHLDWLQPVFVKEGA